MKYEILGLLHYKNLYGYRIRKHLEDHFRYMWDINHGQIYPILQKMREEGLVEVVKELNNPDDNEDKNGTRKMYTITEAGKNEFQLWLNTSPQKGMIIQNKFLTKFLFSDFREKEKILSQIDEQIALFEEEYQIRLNSKDRWDQLNIYVRLIAEFGRAFNALYLDWLRKAKEEILNDLD